VTELIAAAHVHTAREHGPDRVAGFSPIPAMSMVSYSAGTRFLSLIGGTILSFYEFFRDRPVPYFTDYVKIYTDAPFLVTLEERGDGYVPGRFLTAADLGDAGDGSAHKTVMLDAATGEPFVPNGSLGSRFGNSGLGRWNLDLRGADPVLTLYGRARSLRVTPGSR
jgi:nitrate reductase alpha subunit